MGGRKWRGSGAAAGRLVGNCGRTGCGDAAVTTGSLAARSTKCTWRQWQTWGASELCGGVEAGRSEADAPVNRVLEAGPSPSWLSGSNGSSPAPIRPRAVRRARTIRHRGATNRCMEGVWLSEVAHVKGPTAQDPPRLDFATVWELQKVTE